MLSNADKNIFSTASASFWAGEVNTLLASCFVWALHSPAERCTRPARPGSRKWQLETESGEMRPRVTPEQHSLHIVRLVCFRSILLFPNHLQRRSVHPIFPSDSSTWQSLESCDHLDPSKYTLLDNPIWNLLPPFRKDPREASASPTNSFP